MRHKKTFWPLGVLLLLAIAVPGSRIFRKQADIRPPRPQQPAPAKQTDPAADTALPASVRIERVIDGDTLLTTCGHTIRLIGIDAPEAVEPFGDRATAGLEHCVMNRVVRLEYEGAQRDRYGRLLCHIYVEHADGRQVFVNVWLVGRGMAHAYLFPDTQKYAERLISAQRVARKENRGIWSLPEPAPEQSYVASARSFRFHRPSCEHARSISRRNRVVFKTRGSAFDEGLSPCRTCQP